MKKYISHIILLLLPLAGFSQISFQKIIGNSNSTYALDVIQVQDTGYVIAGSSTGYGDHSANAFLMKLDSLGNFLWTKSYGGSNIEGAKQVLENADGTMMLIGHTNSSGNGGYDIYLVKTDANGNLIWEKTFGGTDWDFGYSITPVSTGGYIITGETYSFGNGNNDAFLLRLDDNGDSLWMKTYGSSKNDIGEKVIESYDGRFLFIGTSDSLKADTSKMWLVKTHADGTLFWDKFYGTTSKNYGKSLFESAFFSEIAFVGSSDTGTNKWDNHIYKVDSTGNYLCNWAFGGTDNDYGYDITELLNYDMLIAGEGYSYSNGASDMKAYYALQGCWWAGGPTYGDGEYETGYAIEKTIDGGYIEVGTTTGGPGIISVFVVKADASFSSPGVINTYFDVTNVNTIADEAGAYVYFDQANSALVINGLSMTNMSFELFDISGKLIESRLYNESYISLDGINSGCFIYRLSNRKEYYTGKFIKY